MQRPKKYVKLTNSSGKVLMEGCGCDLDCFGCESEGKTVTEAARCLVPYRKRNLQCKEQEVTKLMIDTLTELHPLPHKQTQYRVGTQNVCKAAFLAVYGITQNKLKKCRDLIHRGKSVITHGSKGGRLSNATEKRAWVSSWVDSWLADNGDQRVGGYYFVSQFIRQVDVHKELVQDWCNEKGITPPPLLGSSNSSSSSSSSSSCCSSSSSSNSSSSSSTTTIATATAPTTTSTSTTVTATATSTTVTATVTTSAPGTDWKQSGLPSTLWPPSINVLQQKWKESKVVFPTTGK